MMELMVGTKFYKLNHNSGYPEVIRLKKQEKENLTFISGGYEAYLTNEEFMKMISSEELIKVKNEEFKRILHYPDGDHVQVWNLIGDISDVFIKFKINAVTTHLTLSYLIDNYVRITPNGFLTISNITYPIGDDTGFDVLCTVHKGTEKIPSIICRQDVFNVFTYSSNQLTTAIGISIPRKACPKNMDFGSFMYSDKVYNFKAVAVYLDDTVNTILKFVGSISKYNVTMRKLYDKYRGTQFVNCKSNIYDLLIENGFYDDFKELFGVFTYPFTIDPSRSTMTDQELKLLNSAINLGRGKKIANVKYSPYDLNIDTDMIDRNFIFVSTGDNKISDIFIISYDLV